MHESKASFFLHHFSAFFLCTQEESLSHILYCSSVNNQQGEKPCLHMVCQAVLAQVQHDIVWKKTHGWRMPRQGSPANCYSQLAWWQCCKLALNLAQICGKKYNSRARKQYCSGLLLHNIHKEKRGSEDTLSSQEDNWIDVVHHNTGRKAINQHNHIYCSKSIRVSIFDYSRNRMQGIIKAQ